MSSSPLLVPVQLQAFVLNAAVCGTGDKDDRGARITPITQPNYTFLRLDNFVIQSDVNRHVDMHNAAPATRNMRMTDLGAHPVAERRNRHGVYLHWMLPRAYRAGVASADSVPLERRNHERLKRGLPAEDAGHGTSPRAGSKSSRSDTPEYIEPPTRWLVVRQLDMDSIRPASAKPNFQEYTAWVIESDHLWSLDDIPLHMDLQVDVAPFVIGTPGDKVDIEQQAEVFIGRRTPLDQWAKGGQPDNNLKISLLSSGNEFFADFQLHNANVFSMLDNFMYGDVKSPQYLDGARASYFLVGWHDRADADPLWKSGQNITHEDRLNALFMTLSDNDEWLRATDPVRLACHGAMYGVDWDNDKKPAHVPADDFARHLAGKKIPAVAVGTTPLDALLAYCSARKGSGEDDDTVAKLEADILLISKLLHARDDGVEGQREATDAVYNWNFSRAPGGTHYFMAGEDKQGKPTQPNAAAISALAELNEYQALLDSCERAGKQYRWDMFSLWWKYVSDVGNKDQNQAMNKKFQDDAEAIRRHLSALQERMITLHNRVDQMLNPADPADPQQVLSKKTNTGTLPFYYRARDPTLLVGGIDPGWPIDYLENVSVRLLVQVIEPTSALPDGLTAVTKLFASKEQAPDFMKPAAATLIAEFYALRPVGGTSQPVDAPPGKKFPQFHSQVDGRWRDQWGGRQPWFPLFVEWEVEYTHVPFDYWSIDEQQVRPSQTAQVRYGVRVPNGKPLYEQLGPPDQHDTRILSGRALILPQPNFSLAAKVQQLFSDTPSTVLDPIISPAQQKELLKGLGKLSYLSLPLTGLTDGLLTLAHGAHIKPENKEVGAGKEVVTVIKAAEFDAAGLTKKHLELIAGQSALTPYAAMVRFADAPHCPFKPASHGQFRFRKINVIDKFGQALVAIDPQPRVSGPPPLYPCISDFYQPQLVPGTKTANTVIRDNEGQCEFVQLPPQINQNARLNAAFVKRTADDLHGGTRKARLAKWRPATEWENPVWGWLVANYADYGLQLFLPDGTFYREVRIGGPNGALVGPKWTPFAPDKSLEGVGLPAASADVVQLDALVDKLRDAEYLKAFWAMVTAALDNMPAAPSSYAQVLNAIVGQPLALVNMGWSLELDGPPLQNQSTNAKRSRPERTLLPPAPGEPGAYYSFQVRLGDSEREYDGLVGYFDAVEKPDKPGHELDLGHINTFYPLKNPKHPPLRPLTTATYPRFTPYWVPPFPEKSPFTAPPIDPDDYADQRNAKLQVFGAILHPFTPVRAYSSVMPAQTLQLPSWTWQAAMNNMTAFFHAGPLTLTTDVSAYDDARRLTTRNMKDTPPANVEVPALGGSGGAPWSWLQPYVDPAAGADLSQPPAFNAFGVEQKGNLLKPGFQPAPYTAIEGFLQLRVPLSEGPKKAPAG